MSFNRHVVFALVFLSFSLSVWPSSYAFALNSFFHACEKALTRPRPPQTFVLFEGEKPVKNYNVVVKNIRAGDDLKFGDGSTFHVKRRFGAGLTTLILDIGSGELLRIPLYVSSNVLDSNPLHFIQDFIEMQPELEANGVPVVSMNLEKSIEAQAVVVKEEPLQFSLEDFLDNEDGEGNPLKFSKEERKELIKKLVEFARKTWMYKRIGDFRPSELGYNGKEWLVFDMANERYPHLLIDDLDSKKNIFSPYPGFAEGSTEIVKVPQLPPELYEKVKDAIRDERRKQKKNPGLFKEIQKRGVYARPGN